MASYPITSWQIEGEKVGAVTDFLFLGSKITVYGDCSREIKRCLLLGRKVVTNLDSILRAETLLCQQRSIYSVQFSHSVESNSCDPMNRSMPGLPVHHHLPDFKLISIESVMPSSISSSVVPFSSCCQSLPASESYPISQLFT